MNKTETRRARLEREGKLPAYRRDYERGWRYSTTSPDPTLDHLDRKGAPDAEYDGYMDAGCGRRKWHLLHCPDHDNCPGDLPVTELSRTS